ncbi:hypothetical protein B0H11DRAFT_2276431 [Mycena galericulata]|nr:hypothetical protein B0H11DRAFT_2276431 [Mycena galericulata]
MPTTLISDCVPPFSVHLAPYSSLLLALLALHFADVLCPLAHTYSAPAPFLLPCILFPMSFFHVCICIPSRPLLPPSSSGTPSSLPSSNLSLLPACLSLVLALFPPPLTHRTPCFLPHELPLTLPSRLPLARARFAPTHTSYSPCFRAPSHGYFVRMRSLPLLSSPHPPLANASAPIPNPLPRTSLPLSVDRSRPPPFSPPLALPHTPLVLRTPSFLPSSYTFHLDLPSADLLRLLVHVYPRRLCARPSTHTRPSHAAARPSAHYPTLHASFFRMRPLLLLPPRPLADAHLFPSPPSSPSSFPHPPVHSSPVLLRVRTTHLPFPPPSGRAFALLHFDLFLCFSLRVVPRFLSLSLCGGLPIFLYRIIAL